MQHGESGRLQKNIQPRTREERRNLADKETLEKDRLKKRNEGYNRYVDLGKVTEPLSDAVGYLAEHERFDTDSAFEEKSLRDAALEKRELMYERKRIEQSVREEDRWTKIDAQKREQELKEEQWREDGSKAKRNTSSVPYNPITLMYNDTLDGERLRHADNTIRYRAALRAAALQSRMTCEGFNPVTGESMNMLDPPNPPGPVPAGPPGSKSPGGFGGH